MDALNNAQQGNIDQGLIFLGEYIEKISEILPAGKIIADLVEAYEKI
jgi:nitronate monooxygenase